MNPGHESEKQRLRGLTNQTKAMVCPTNTDHTGVQIGSREYTFSNAGVIYHSPLQAGEEAVFKETIDFGEVRKATLLLDSLKQRILTDRPRN